MYVMFLFFLREECALLGGVFFSEVSTFWGHVLGNGCPKIRRHGAGTPKSSLLSARRVTLKEQHSEPPHRINQILLPSLFLRRKNPR